MEDPKFREMRTPEENILQDWIPSGDIITRFFNYENMISFAKHYHKIMSKTKNQIDDRRDEKLL